MRKLTAIFLLCFASVGRTYEPERAKSNFAHEAAECSAFFLLISATPELDEATVTGLRAKYEALARLSINVSSTDVYKARLSLASETMRREMKHSWSNLSIVLNKYNYRCGDFANDPEARLKYWFEKRD